MPATPTAKQDTPAMRQHRRFKEQHPGCVLFFRMGDFYEMFYEDAVLANKVLGVALTQRTKDVPMAGVPYHSVDGYLRRMIQAGHRVAVCDQLETPAQAKGVVKRGVTRVITPGTLTDESLLEEGTENPLTAVVLHDAGRASLAWAELSTGAFSIATLPADQLPDEVARIAPGELLFPEEAATDRPGQVADLVANLNCSTTGRPSWHFRLTDAVQLICDQFAVTTLEGFGLRHDDPALAAAGAVLRYLLETQSPGSDPPDPAKPARALAHLRPPHRLTRSDYLVIDQTSLRSLEIERTIRSGATEGSLLGVIQGCVTGMGKRELRRWLCYPLQNRQQIETRQRVVGAMVTDERFLTALRTSLRSVQDLERMAGRVAVGRATPRDVVGLGTSIARAGELQELLAERPAVKPYHDDLAAVSPQLTDLAARINDACVDQPPAHLREGGLIRDGHDTKLDEYRRLQSDSQSWLANYQKQLTEQSGITTLKVGYNRVFGYYIEVSAVNVPRAPQEWTAKQTLKNAQRYITPELKTFEEKVLSAKTLAEEREQELFAELCNHIHTHLAALHAYAQTVAALDVLACFADRARRFSYTQPRIVDEPVLDIRAGRHPVLDELLRDRFVPNDVALGKSGHEEDPASTSGGAGVSGAGGATLALITGPNMAGKSTYIRQSALITLLAHTGSYVPAESATVGLCDRIFTRVGASDELHAGQSTFMVEMVETANICHHATASSLVILDEIGRGTSTLDGLSLAWAIAEHLAERACRTMFATHYHELTTLAEQFQQVTNLNVTVREWGDQVVFLHRIVPGATDRSYGIHVAKIAGLPKPVVTRADQLLAQLAVSHTTATPPTTTPRNGDQNAPTDQLPLFTEYIEHPALNELRSVDINTLSPLEAFDWLRRVRQEMGKA